MSVASAGESGPGGRKLEKMSDLTTGNRCTFISSEFFASDL